MRNYNLGTIKRRRSYDTAQIGSLLGVDRKTVHRWVGDGLRPIAQNRKPLLFMGQELFDFLKGRQDGQKTKLGEGEFFCFKCQRAVRPRDGTERTEKTGKRVGRDGLEQYWRVGLCGACGTRVLRLLPVYSDLSQKN